MGVNLESRNLYRLYQRQPVSSWSRFDTHQMDCPVRIHTLGRFSIESHSGPISRSQVRHQRPLQLLQALIAFGGRDVHDEILSQALWPDADGDNARNAFDVTLYRLRKLIDMPDLLIARDRHLTLNNNLAWVDAWAFEQLINHSERLLTRADDAGVARQLARCGERILNIYQGSFLEREASRPWALTLRERLRSKLLRYIIDAGRVWEAAGEWDRAIRFYHKGLETDPLIEALYQRLIICFRETGRSPEAQAIFHQCRSVLAAQFQTSPSRQTLNLYTSVKT